MVIAVTGAAGNVGPFVVAELIEHGHEVVAVDLREPSAGGAAYRNADVELVASLVEAFDGCDAIVHLAAIAEDGIAPPDVTFRVNAMGTLNCLEAATKVGASRFVLASSEAVLGFAYRRREFKPDYFPIDERHPLRPQDSYGLSKIAAEEACRAYTRRGALSTVCIRPCYCWGSSSATRRSSHCRTRAFTTARSGSTSTYATSPAPTGSPARRRGIEHESFYVVASDVRSNVPTAELVERYYPGVPARAPPGNLRLVDRQRSRQRGARVQARAELAGRGLARHGPLDAR